MNMEHQMQPFVSPTLRHFLPTGEVIPMTVLPPEGKQKDAEFEENESSLATSDTMEIKNVRSIFKFNSFQLKCVVCGLYDDPSRFIGKFCGSECIARSKAIKAELGKAALLTSKENAYSDQYDSGATKSDVPNGNPKVDASSTLVSNSAVELALCDLCGAVTQGSGGCSTCSGDGCETVKYSSENVVQKPSCLFCGNDVRPNLRYCSRTCISKHTWVRRREKEKRKAKENFDFPGVWRRVGNGEPCLRVTRAVASSFLRKNRGTFRLKTSGNARGKKSFEQTRPKKSSSVRNPNIKVERSPTKGRNENSVPNILKISTPPSSRKSPSAQETFSLRTPIISLTKVNTIEDFGGIKLAEQEHQKPIAEQSQAKELECAAIKSEIELYETKKKLCVLQLSKTKLEMEHLAEKHALELDVLEGKKTKINREDSKIARCMHASSLQSSNLGLMYQSCSTNEVLLFRIANILLRHVEISSFQVNGM